MDNRKITLSFEPKDIPWLFHALIIQKTTTMMCGGSEGIKSRIESYLECLRNSFPFLANPYIEEYEMFDALSRLAQCKKWTIYRKPVWHRQPLKDQPIFIKVDDYAFKIIDYNATEEIFNDLKQFVESCSPLISEYYDYEVIDD